MSGNPLCVLRLVYPSVKWILCGIVYKELWISTHFFSELALIEFLQIHGKLSVIIHDLSQIAQNFTVISTSLKMM